MNRAGGKTVAQVTHSGAAPNQVRALTSVPPTTPAMPLAENTRGYTLSLPGLLLLAPLTLPSSPSLEVVLLVALLLLLLLLVVVLA